MSTGTIAVIVIIAIIAAVAATIGATRLARRRRLKRRFGAEYYRLVDDRQSRSKAEAELVLRVRHVGDLGIRPLAPELRDQYVAEWAIAKERFVDAPAHAVVDAQNLVNTVLQDCGYPLSHREQVISDLSVDHASTLDHFRAACQISERANAGTASTEDMRQAMIHYRVLFDDLLGTPESPTIRTVPVANGALQGRPAIAALRGRNS